MLNIFLILFGIVLGTFCGVFPGLHPNSISAIISSFGIEQITQLLVAMLGVYSVMIFLPSIIFGIPDGETAISLLPGQRMYLEGKLLEAIFIVTHSALIAGLLASLAGYWIIYFFVGINTALKPYMGYILIFASVFFIIRQKEKVYSALFYILCALWGYFVFQLNLPDPLFAMFVGFFTLPAIFYTEECKNIEQQSTIENKKIDFLKYVIGGVILGAIADFLPGISSPAQLAAFSALFMKVQNPRNFLAHLVAIETSHNMFALSTVAGGGIARVGTISIAKNLFAFSPFNYGYHAAIFLFSLLVGVFLLLKITYYLKDRITKLEIKKISYVIGVYLIVMIVLIDGLIGLFILSLSTIIGFIPYKMNISRINVMASIIGPTTFYLFS
ncbi:MAG: tripartite tricarboxylate transporter permease [Candidatus Anstonellaceae archaeon]